MEFVTNEFCLLLNTEYTKGGQIMYVCLFVYNMQSTVYFHFIPG